MILAKPTECDAPLTRIERADVFFREFSSPDEYWRTLTNGFSSREPLPTS